MAAARPRGDEAARVADVKTGPGASDPQPSLEDRLRLIEAVMAFEPSVYLFGGVAEDAMLHGSWVRPHDDIDVLVERADLPRQLENARTLGFGSFETRFQPLAATPVVVGSIERGQNLEISVVDRSLDGSPFFYMVDVRADVIRIEVSEDIFGYAPCMLDGIEVRTVSPLAQFQIRAGIAMAGGFGPLRAKDVTAQRALQERFYPDTPIEDLSPTIVPLPE